MKKKFTKVFIAGFALISGISIFSTKARAITYQDLFTNYRVKDCEYVEYDMNTYYRNPIDDSIIIGKIIDSNDQSIEKINLTAREYGPGGINKTPIKLSKYAYCYTYLTTISAPYQDRALGQFKIDKEAESKGLYPSVILSLEEIKSTTYEEKVVETVSAELSSSIKGEYCGIGAELKSKLSTSISESFAISSTLCTQEKISYEHKITQSGYYRIQRRALYDVYAISIYEIMYHPTVIDKSNWYTKDIRYDYANGTKTYKYLGTENVLKFITDYSFSLNRYIYDKNLKKYVYDGFKDEATNIYI